MKNLETLIQELCPDGVEFVKLGDVCDILDSKRKPVAKGRRIKGEYPYYGANGIQDYIDGYIFDGTYLLLGEDGSVINKDNSPVLNWATGKIWVNNHAHVLAERNDIALLRYLYYVLQTCDVSSIVRGMPPKLNQENLRNIEIPLPPIDVQTEIVRILDKFTSLEAELEAGLEAELDCRKRQYEYYRDKLLSFDNVGGQEVEWKKMSEVGTFIRGNGLQKKDFTEEGVGCIHYGQLYTHYGTSATETITYCSSELAKKLRKAAKGDIVIATTSENVEDVCKAVAWLGEEEIAVSGDAFIYKHTQNPKYMAYLFQTASFFNYKKKKATGTKVIRLTGDAMGNYLAPIPSLEEQQRIVSILDRFESLTTSLQSGLPAEIAARRQQYEYYRDKLLTFKRKGAA